MSGRFLTVLFLLAACGDDGAAVDDAGSADAGGPAVVATGTVARAMRGVRFEDLEPVAGAQVCLHGGATCVTTGVDGSFRLEGVPAHAEVALAMSHEGYRSALLPVLTDERPVRASLALEPDEASQARNAAAGVEADPDLGSIGFVATDETGAALLADVSAEMAPSPGAGPFYVDDLHEVDPALSATSERGFGFAVDLPPGEVVLRLSHATRACDVPLVGWPGAETGAIRAPIGAGFETVVIAACAPR